MKKSISSKKNKILIVDDDKSVLDFLTRFLKEKGYKNIQAVETGKEALKTIKKEDIKLVLLDIRLPDINGLEVLRKIKKMKKDIDVLMITAFADKEIGNECLKEGAYDYIMKPFDLAYLELSVLAKIATRM